MARASFKLKPIERQSVCQSVYIQKLNKTIEFSIGVKEDGDALLDYYEVVAYYLKPVDRAASKYNSS